MSLVIRPYVTLKLVKKILLPIYNEIIKTVTINVSMRLIDVTFVGYISTSSKYKLRRIIGQYSYVMLN